MLASCFLYQPGWVALRILMAAKSTRSSSLVGLSSSEASSSALAPRWMSRVASPPSSRIMLGAPSGNSKILCVKSQYSLRLSPL
jgi:hypothetical protein